MSLSASPLGALGDVFGNAQLRRVQLAWAAHHVGEWAHFMALSLWAFDRSGAGAVGVLGFVRMAPAAFAMPFISVVVDRYPRHRVLVALTVARAATMVAIAAALIADVSTPGVFALAAVATVVGVPVRAVTLALSPSLARTPRELVAANVSVGALEGLGTMLGPAVGGLLTALWGPEAGVTAAAVAYLVGAAALARLDATGADIERRPTSGVRDIFGGLAALREDWRPALVVALFAAQTFVRGVLNVLVVLVAAAVFTSADAGVGWLNGGIGMGGLLGGVAAVRLVDRRRLAVPFGVALTVWGAPIIAIGAWHHAAFAVACLGVVGVGNALLDVSGFTLLQRTVDEHVLGRVFGVFELSTAATLAVGSLIGPVLYDRVGLTVALVVCGTILPVLAIASLVSLRRVDASTEVPEREVAALRATSLFAPLPATTLERVASNIEPRTITPGTELVTEGDAPRLFYVIERGTLDVTQNGRYLRTLGPGDVLGEIGLLATGRRTATVTATTNAHLFSLDGDTFRRVLSGDRAVSAHADVIATVRMRNEDLAGYG